MSDTPDLSLLAREFLDLWEDQLTAIAADPELAQQSARFFEALGAFGAQANPLLSAQFSALMRNATGQAHDSDTGTSAPAGTSAASASPGERDERMDDLTRRIADLEKRIAELESRPARTRGGSAKRTQQKPAAKRG